MLPDAKWLDALAFPAKVTGGIAASCIVILLLDRGGILPLSVFGPLAWYIALTCGIIFGCLFLAAMIDAAFKYWDALNKPKRLAAERQAIRDENAAERKQHEEQILRRLDFLSEEEIEYVADSLRKNAQSFQTYVHSPPVTAMIGKGLVYTPGGQHHQDYYPFSFHDFAWVAMLERKGEFIAKDDAFQATKARHR
ncbi:hypothetical protein AB9F46_04395 [Rhizobium leguminosarum]|uniref:hypothetical protein n=1 Tax=Rhizobium leguminosarum TaxID=384 RepID=UPI001C96D667|nr:hypothetical protein [Rhizobium leguminosarum]MBY5327248.1 hypothetical protein [Rhizobium leguminosarum]